MTNGNKAARNSNSNSTVRTLVSDYRFVPNKLPKYPLASLDAIFDAFLNAVQVFATPDELINTKLAVEEFKQTGSVGRKLYDRAKGRANDPNISNWEFDLQLQSGYLNRGGPLTPYVSFWFSHPLSKRRHSQAERAALVTYAASKYRAKLFAGHVEPVVLNEHELTTAYHEWIFNSVRIPGIGRDEMKRFSDPKYSYCVALWKGYAFKISLVINDSLATYEELLSAFEQVVNQRTETVRSSVSIFTAESQNTWAETRHKVQKLHPQNAESIAAIEAAAFIV